jgi:RNA ligase
MINGLNELNAFDVHPARQMDFDQLLEALHAAKAERALMYVDGPDDLQLWKYSNRCVYDRMWTKTTVLGRGLILDLAERKVVATPFPKFFNLGEDGGGLPDMPFEVFEKLDGSLIILFHHRGKWRTVTRGAFESSQAKWAAEQILSCNVDALVPGTTYLAEAVYPENKIVVHYDEPALVMLAGYHPDGGELSYAEVQASAQVMGWRAAERYQFNSIAEMMQNVAGLPRDQEGYVLRFENGLRIKLKGSEYRRIHALISNVTPLAVWELLSNGDDVEAIRRDLPEEFWTDFDDIVAILKGGFDDRITKVKEVCEPLAGQTDKEVGLQLASFPAEARPYIFLYRKDGAAFPSDRAAEKIWRDLRPTGNELEGYVPSFAMNRLVEDAL